MTDDPKPLPRVPKPQLELTIPAKTVAEALQFWMNKTQRNPQRPVTVLTGHLRMDPHSKALTFIFEEDDPQPIPFRQGSEPA